MEMIPNDMKTVTINTIPEQVKVELFNSVIKTALPNFDNLMMASWNVISIYSACGSDFPEMHRAIVELKDVLQDFDTAFGASVNRTAPPYRHDWAAKQESNDNRNHSRLLPAGNQPGKIISIADTLNPDKVTRDEKVSEGVAKALPSDASTHTMRPPRTKPATQDSTEEELVDAEETSSSTVKTSSTHSISQGQDARRSRDRSTTRPSPEYRMTEDTPGSTISQALPLDHQPTLESAKSSQVAPSKNHEPAITSPPATAADLARLRQEYASAIDRANLTSNAGASRVDPRSDREQSLTVPTNQATLKRKRSVHEFTTEQLQDKLEARKEYLRGIYGNMADVPQKQMGLVRNLEDELSMREERAKLQRELRLGNSVLGAKREKDTMTPLGPANRGV